MEEAMVVSKHNFIYRRDCCPFCGTVRETTLIYPDRITIECLGCMREFESVLPAIKGG